MTKKVYVKFARILYEQMILSTTSDNERLLIRSMAYKMADEFASDNPRFDRTRFLRACGIDL